jgi:hypothetical protein
MGLLFTSVNACWSASVVQSTGHAECLAEAARTDSVNRAALDVVGAKLELQRWRLDQLEALLERGHATWLEVARQKLVVDTLVKQQAAMTEFTSFNYALLQRLQATAPVACDDAATSRDSSAAPIKLWVRGSVRLAGWIRRDQVPVELQTLLDTSAPANSTPDAVDQQLAAARDALSRAEIQYETLAQHDTVSPHWLRQAELQRRVAEAELRLCEIEDGFRKADEQDLPRASHVAQQVTTDRADAVCVPANVLQDCLTPRSRRDLGLATLRVARLEENATGRLDAATLAVRRLEGRCQALDMLSDNGFADPAERAAARDQLARAQRQVAQLQEQHGELVESRVRLQQWLAEAGWAESSPQADTVQEAGPANSLDPLGTDDWPSLATMDVELLRHALELRRIYCEAVAAREALLLEIAILETYRDKLARCLADEPDTEEAVWRRNTADPALSVSVGTRRQLDDLRLEIRYHRAQLQAAHERLAILVAEERRFVSQCIAQQTAADRSATVTAASVVGLTHVAGLTSSLVAVSAPRDVAGGRLSYLESDYFAGPRSLRRCAFAPVLTDDLRFALNDYDGWAWYRGPRAVFRSYTYFGGGIAGTIRDGLAEPLTCAPRPYDSKDAYPFGILRSDLRRQQLPGQPPWYLPGSPTNFRYRLR